MSPVKVRKPIVKVLADADAVSRECLQQFISAAENAVKSRGIFHFAISGGHTPKEFFELLASEPQVKSLEWSKMHVFWVDERYVLRIHR